jgi:hypothetical protein
VPIIIHENELLLQVLWSLGKIQRDMETLMSQQQGLDAAVSGLGVDFQALSNLVAAEIQALKDAQANGQPLDFTGLNAIKTQFDTLAATAAPTTPPTTPPTS